MVATNRKLLTTGEAAKLMGFHIGTVRRWASLGLIPYTRAGLRRDRRFKRKDVLEYVKNCQGTMDRDELEELARELGIRYDGIQHWPKGDRHQFTDTSGAGSTFYGNTPEEIKRNLKNNRRPFAEDEEREVMSYKR